MTTDSHIQAIMAYSLRRLKENGPEEAPHSRLMYLDVIIRPGTGV
jgi:hypothetical protein